MDQQLQFVTLLSSDEGADPIVQPGGRVTAAAFRQKLGAPLELPDGADSYQVALVSVQLTGVPLGGPKSLLLYTDACRATSRLGSVMKRFLQSIPGEADATGGVTYQNEGASLVVWRPADRDSFSEIEIELQSAEDGSVIDCTNAVITLCFRHVSLY